MIVTLNCMEKYVIDIMFSQDKPLRILNAQLLNKKQRHE